MRSALFSILTLFLKLTYCFSCICLFCHGNPMRMSLDLSHVRVHGDVQGRPKVLNSILRSLKASRTMALLAFLTGRAHWKRHLASHTLAFTSGSTVKCNYVVIQSVALGESIDSSFCTGMSFNETGLIFLSEVPLSFSFLLRS